MIRSFWAWAARPSLKDVDWRIGDARGRGQLLTPAGGYGPPYAQAARAVVRTLAFVLALPVLAFEWLRALVPSVVAFVFWLLLGVLIIEALSQRLWLP